MSEQPPPPPSEDRMTSSESPGSVVDEGKARIFPCEGCGADLKFNIGDQSLKCPFCGFEKAIEIAEDKEVEEQDFDEMLIRLRQQHLKTAEGANEHDGEQEIRCNACGGTVVFIGTLTSSECPYCASPIQLENVHDAEDRIPVDGVLPFQVNEKKAQENLVAWVKSRWFAPNEFKKRGVDGKFNGVYLPFWTFDSLTFTRYRGERGEYYYVTVGSGDDERRERRTRWYKANGDFQRFFDDVLVIAAQGMNPKLVIKLEPWPLGQAIPFTQEVLAGHLARTYDTELEDGFKDAKKRIDAALRQEVEKRIGGDEQRVRSINTSYSAITFKHLLLPVWLLAYRYHDKAYQVMINAATGEVQGQRPYSWLKIGTAITCAIAAVVGFYLLTKPGGG